MSYTTVKKGCRERERGTGEEKGWKDVRGGEEKGWWGAGGVERGLLLIRPS